MLQDQFQYEICQLPLAVLQDTSCWLYGAETISSEGDDGFGQRNAFSRQEIRL
jgi:hypothetical protein